MACRCDDLTQMRADLATLIDAYGKVTRLKHLDTHIAEYLQGISSVIDSTIIVPQCELPRAIKVQNEKASAAILDLDVALQEAQEKLLEDIEAAEAEDSLAH